MTTKGPIQFATSFPPWTRALVIAEITKTYKLINTNTFKQSAVIIYRNHTPLMHTIHVVNAVLLKVRPNLYQPRYNLSAMNIKQNTINTATIPWTINATTTGHDLVSYRWQYGHKQLRVQCFNQDMIHTATTPWIINATTLGAISLVMPTGQ